MFGLYPFTGKDPEDGESYEGRQKIWEWLVKLMSYGGVKDFPAVFSNSFYLDNSSRAMLQEKGIFYHCSVRKAWYKNIKAHLEAQVNEMGRWAARQPSSRVARFQHWEAAAALYAPQET